MMIKQRYSVVILIAFLIAAGGVTKGQDADTTLALTYAYLPKESAADLANGYKKHLEWHSANNDPILWYAWFIVEGDRLGHFIDGAFDVTGAQFDSRPDPAGDAADAMVNFVPFVDMQYRRIFRLRRDLGTSSFLEDRNPSPLMQVIYYHIRPGTQSRFEAAASAIAGAARQKSIDYAIYEMLTGTSGPLYAMYVPLDGFGSFDNPTVSLELAARIAMPEVAFASAMTDLAFATQSTNSEVWQYRSDLSLIPSKN